MLAIFSNNSLCFPGIDLISHHIHAAPLTISAITPIISSEAIGLLFDGLAPADFYEVSLLQPRDGNNKVIEEIQVGLYFPDGLIFIRCTI